MITIAMILAMLSSFLVWEASQSFSYALATACALGAVAMLIAEARDEIISELRGQNTETKSKEEKS